MKKTQVINIGLLAASVAAFSSCHHPYHRHPLINEWDQDNCYVDDGYGYAPFVYWHPMYVGYYPGYYGGTFISNRTSVVYRTSSGYRATSGGRVSRTSPVTRGSTGYAGHTSRGGFGSSRHASAGS